VLFRSALALLALAAVLPAQAGKAQAATATAEYDKLVADWKAETTANRDARKKVTDSPEYKAAAEAKDNAKLRELMGAVKAPDRKAFGERALKLADQFGDDGLQFLTYAAQNLADKDVAKGIAERVEAKFVKSPKLGEFVETGRGVFAQVGAEAADALLAKIASENKDDQVKAWALYQQGNLLRAARMTDEQKAKMTDEQKAKADAQKTKMAELHAAAEKLAKGDLADRIAAPRFQQEHLQIGMQVPEIVGEDIDAVPFKLSDYRGKVVVIDFWGYW